MVRDGEDPALPDDHTHSDYADGFDAGREQVLSVVGAKCVRLYRADNEIRLNYATREDANAAFELIQNTAVAGVNLPEANR